MMLDTDQAEKLQITKFMDLLQELLKQGYGELNYKVVVRDGKLEYISLTKTNTFKVESV